MKMNNISKTDINPFSLMFGCEPYSMIPRREYFDMIISDFDSIRPRTYAYVITGVRGCGKTVLLSCVQKHYEEKKDWVVLRLNPDIDLFESAVSQLAEVVDLGDDALSGFNVSIAGVGAGFAKRSFSNNETLLRKQLNTVKKVGKKVLLAIDEVTNTNNIKTFFHSYQAFLGEGLQVFLLVTSLPENFYSLSNSKNCTYLKRLPKIRLEQLNSTRIKNAYMDIFSISEERAFQMAKLVSGYPYAYQVLGDLMWVSKESDITDYILREFDATLDECVYTPIWEHLTDTERRVVSAIASIDSDKVKNIREKLKMESNEFAPYSNRLSNLGIIDTRSYGVIRFTLPRFDVFVRNRCLLSM